MGTEKIAFERWKDRDEGRPMQPIPADVATHWSIGKDQPGSSNHGPMTVGCALLERSERINPTDGLQPIIAHARRILKIQKDEGHRVNELGGYSHYHVAAVISMLIAAWRFTERGIVGAKELYNESLDWLADELSIRLALRCGDGSMLSIGCRARPHEPKGEKLWKSAVEAIITQILSPLPQGQLTPWLKVLVPPNITDLNTPHTVHKDSIFGWHKPGTNNDAVCLRLILYAIRIGALDLSELAQISTGRHPKINGEIYTWTKPNEYHAAATALAGLPPRCFYSRQVNGHCETVVFEESGGGSGRHDAPEAAMKAIPKGLKPTFTDRAWQDDKGETPALDPISLAWNRLGPTLSDTPREQVFREGWKESVKYLDSL